MISRELTNNYGSYSKKDLTTIQLKGVFDKNFIDLSTVDPSKETYKVFESPKKLINFAIKLGNSTYIPQHIFDRLKKAYEENDPYYNVNSLVTVELNLSSIIPYIDSKYNVKTETSQVFYIGSETKVQSVEPRTRTSTITTKSGSIDVRQTATITTNEPVETVISEVKANFVGGQASRLEIAGVLDVQYQFFVDNSANVLNDEVIISYIKYVFEETNTPPMGTNQIVKFQNSDGSVILENLPASTNVVKPAIDRVTKLDDYLRDVQRQ